MCVVAASHAVADSEKQLAVPQLLYAFDVSVFARSVLTRSRFSVYRAVFRFSAEGERGFASAERLGASFSFHAASQNFVDYFVESSFLNVVRAYGQVKKEFRVFRIHDRFRTHYVGITQFFYEFLFESSVEIYSAVHVVGKVAYQSADAVHLFRDYLLGKFVLFFVFLALIEIAYAFNAV